MLDRVENRIAAENADEERATVIRAEEARKGERTAVAGYDLTFSPPKSVSVLWGLADRDTADVIEAAHDRAITKAFEMLEAEAAFTRTGRNGIGKRRRSRPRLGAISAPRFEGERPATPHPLRCVEPGPHRVRR